MKLNALGTTSTKRLLLQKCEHEHNLRCTFKRLTLNLVRFLTICLFLIGELVNIAVPFFGKGLKCYFCSHYPQLTIIFNIHCSKQYCAKVLDHSLFASYIKTDSYFKTFTCGIAKRYLSLLTLLY